MRLLALIAGLAWFPHAAVAQGAQKVFGVVSGTVVDGGTGFPVRMAVLVLNGRPVATTGPDGRFEIQGVETEVTNVLDVRRIGFAPINMEVWVDREDTSLELLLELTLIPQQLDPIEVTAEGLPVNRKLVEFEARRKLGFGEFMTRAEFEDRQPVLMTDLLRRFRRLRVTPNPNYGFRNPRTGLVDARLYVVGGRRGDPLGGRECPVLYYLDGSFVGTSATTGISIDRFIGVDAVDAIEVYSGLAEIPPRFNRPGAGCGVVVIWTR